MTQTMKTKSSWLSKQSAGEINRIYNTELALAYGISCIDTPTVIKQVFDECFKKFEEIMYEKHIVKSTIPHAAKTVL